MNTYTQVIVIYMKPIYVTIQRLGTDGQVSGGNVVGLLIAASPFQPARFVFNRLWAY